jgi:glycosyltransferase involved in cell wall biosynthesis
MIGEKHRSIVLAIPTITSYNILLNELAEALLKEGWSVHIATSLNPIHGFDCYDAPVTGIAHDIAFPRGANLAAHLRAGSRLNDLVEDLRPSIVHCHLGATAFTASLGRTSQWPATIATIQGLIFPVTSGAKRTLFWAAENLIRIRMDGTWVLTQSDVDSFDASASKRKVFLQKSLGFGCRLDTFDRRNFNLDTKLELRRRLGIAERDFVFVFVGRQVVFKGFHLLVRAFVDLAATRSDVRLLLIGDKDPMHPTGLRPEEEENLRRLPSVSAVGWQKDVPRFLAIAQVNVFPSVREGMPINLMESLAMGVPVITANSRGCRDVVRDGIDGIVISDPSKETVGHAMVRLIDDQILYHNMSQNAEAGRLRFDRNTWICEQLQIYERIWESPNPRKLQ